MQRTKEIKIRLTECEHQVLISKKTKTRLAEWIRDTALFSDPQHQIKVADPKLLFELNRIGVNLNQIARQCNSQKPSIELVSVLAELRNIEKKLNEIREKTL